MPIKLKKQAASTVQTPASTHVQMFVDSDGLPKTKDSTGVVTQLSQSAYVTLDEQVSAPPTLANKARLYSKDVSGAAEFFVLDDQGNEVQVTSGGALAGGDISVNVSSSPIDLEVGHSYVCYPNPVTAHLPDGATVERLGERLTISFIFPSRVVLDSPYGDGGNNAIITETGQLSTGSDFLLDSGVYDFKSVDATDLIGPGKSVWVIQRWAGTYGRRSIDVDYCLEGSFPTGAIKTADPLTGRWSISGSGTTPAQPTLDDNGSYAVGQTVLVPFDVDPTQQGLYRVAAPGMGQDWLWTLIEDVGSGSQSYEFEYRILHGEAYGSRRFYTNKSETGPDTDLNYTLQLTPPQIWPDDGTALNGGGVGTHAHDNDVLLTGRINFLTIDDDLEFELKTPPGFNSIIGERFGIKIVGTDGLSHDITITVPDDQLIEPNDSALGPALSVTLAGMLKYGYAEWQLDAGGAWRMMSFAVGLSGG